MKATWGETSGDESKGEDGDNENLALMAKSDTNSYSDSSEAEMRGNNKKWYLDSGCSKNMTGLKPNLLSISQLYDRGNTVFFSSLDCKVVNNKFGEIVLTGK
ncbi:hypothetical protein HAX54_051923 [Datura stramonium]|uniref:Gag-pol polyprotein n=1 Tax=Datura stramonium TaxID=4076 RepID=A0ABS8WRW2_DATST|nr:hypothetical protein [Datura stramonium]